MIHFDNLSIRGFCSIGEFDLNLNQKGITLIKGPNGVGKSNFLSALTWVLYGKNLKGVSDVNTWKKFQTKSYLGTMVSIYFRNETASYRVVRCLNYRDQVEGSIGANRLILYKDAEQVQSKKKNDVQGEIIEALGLSYHLFMSSVMFGQGMKRLAQETNSDKKMVFEEIFNIQYLTEARDLAKDQYSVAISKLERCKSLYEGNKRSLEAVKNALLKAQEEARTFSKLQKKKIKALKDDRNHLKLELEKLKSKLPLFDDDKFKRIGSEIEEAKDALRKVNKSVDDISLEDLLDNIIELLESKDYKKALSDMKALRKLLLSIEVHEKHISTLIEEHRELSDEKSELRVKRERVRACEQTLNNTIGTIEELKSEPPPRYGSDLELRRDKLLEELNQSSREINVLERSTETLKWVYNDALGNNGIKAFLFDSSIGELNNILKTYNDSIGISIQFIIDTTTTKKDLDTLIMMDGIPVMYEELSGGQKQLVNLAMAFAMNELMLTSRGINIAFLDEVFESLSFDNIELVVALIKKAYKEKNLFLITHHDSLPLGNARTIQVVRDQGISSYHF